MVAVFEAAWSSPRRIPISRHRLAPGPTPPFCRQSRRRSGPALARHQLDRCGSLALVCLWSWRYGTPTVRHVRRCSRRQVCCCFRCQARCRPSTHCVSSRRAAMPCCGVAFELASDLPGPQAKKVAACDSEPYLPPPARRLHLCTYENTQVAKLTTSDIKIDGPVARAFEPVSGSLSHAATKGGKRRVTWETTRDAGNAA